RGCFGRGGRPGTRGVTVHVLLESEVGAGGARGGRAGRRRGRLAGRRPGRRPAAGAAGGEAQAGGGRGGARGSRATKRQGAGRSWRSWRIRRRGTTRSCRKGW